MFDMFHMPRLVIDRLPVQTAMVALPKLLEKWCHYLMFIASYTRQDNVIFLSPLEGINTRDLQENATMMQ